jgi:predicted DNA-binding protein (MmcQ/YjbR family)
MTIESLRAICRALPDVTEDVKWGGDLCFCVGRKMFVVVNLEPPHQVSFKCTPESFGELVERPGLIPAPYMARNMWVQEQVLGETLDRLELAALVRTSYELVVAKLPKSRRPGATSRRAERAASGSPRPRRRAKGGRGRSGPRGRRRR